MPQHIPWLNSETRALCMTNNHTEDIIAVLIVFNYLGFSLWLINKYRQKKGYFPIRGRAPKLAIVHAFIFLVDF